MFIDEDTVSQHIKGYQQKRKLKNTSGESESKLGRHKSEYLITHLEKHIYLNAYQIIVYVRKKHEITYSQSDMVMQLHQHDFSYKEPTKRPAKCDPEKQETFSKHIYTKLKNSLSGDAVILFDNGIHPYYGGKDIVWLN